MMTSKKPKTLNDLRNDPRVHEVHKEASSDSGASHSYWLTLKDGWEFRSDPENGSLHEDTLKELLERFDPVETTKKEPTIDGEPVERCEHCKQLVDAKQMKDKRCEYCRRL